MKILDVVIEQITLQIAAHPPERGGMLFGPRCSDLITLFIYDEAAETTASTYSPSEELRARIPQIELEYSLSFKGVVHSHPGGLDRPSLGDHAPAKNLLKHNPHLGCIYLPIVVRGDQFPNLQDHEITLKGGKLSMFTVWRAPFHPGSTDEN